MSIKIEYSLKRVTALLFLLFAGTIILAHAVIPHHHHDGISCISYVHHNPSEQHRNDMHEECLLTKVYLRYDNKQIFKLHDFDFDPFLCLLTLFSANSASKTNDNVVLPFEQKPYLFSDHTEFIVRATGLRAPPELKIEN